MTNMSPSLILPDDAKQAARNTPPPLPPLQPGELQKSARIQASNSRNDDNDGYRKPYCKSTQTSLDQNLAKHIHTATKALQPTPPHVVDIMGPHVTPNCLTKPPEPTTPAALLKNNFFAPLAPTNDDGSKNSDPDWESDIDDGDPPPELLGADPHLKAIVKMLQDHRREATSKILSLRRYLLNKMKGHSDKTLQAFQWEQGQR
jgi:hypothetical protein